MASNKEAIVIILDVSQNANRPIGKDSTTFLDREKECCTRLLQKKIFEAKKDEVALVLMGTQETQNRSNVQSVGYDNICEVYDLNVPDWNLVRAVNRCEAVGVEQADWQDAIEVALALFYDELKNKKFGVLKIVLFASFTAIGRCSGDQTSIKDSLKSLGVELVAISDNIDFCLEDENSEHGKYVGYSQATFSQAPGKMRQQAEAETLILDILNETDGNLTNFENLIDHLTKFQKKKARPYYWYAKLEIGKDLEVQIAATITIKNESHFRFKIASKDENLVLRYDTELYRNGEKVNLDSSDLIKGYMIGSTPIAYDETLGVQKDNTVKGLRCLAFTKLSLVAPQLLTGNGTYQVIAKDGDSRSQKLFRLLAKSMERMEYALIARRVYAARGKPKLVVLTPNSSAPIPALNMYELVYGDQVHHWYFPQLCTRKTEPSPEQYQAIDELIDAMDLMDAGEGDQEAFPHSKLVSPVIQNIYETVTKRALDPQYQVQVFDDRLEQALKVPETVLQRSAEPCRKVRDLFKMEEPKALKKELVRKLCNIPAESGDGGQAFGQLATTEDTKKVFEVGTVNPEEDYKTLLNEDVNAFPRISEQLGNVLYDLIFKSMTDQSEKVCDAMTTFREFAKFYGPYVYTEWIRNIKATVETRKKSDFWQDVVDRNRLGIISASESEQVVSVTDEEAEEFYRISASTDGAQEEEADVDDLFGQM